MARAHRTALAVVGVVLVLCVLLGVGADPGSGTATNLHPISDVGSQVVGEHHAKPLPRSGAVVVALVLLTIAAAVLLVAPRSTTVLRRLSVADLDDDVVAREQVLGRRSAPRRGPPAPLPA